MPVKDPRDVGLSLIEMIVGLLVSTIVLVAVATVLGMRGSLRKM